MPNVLIFESDLEFANELQTELINRACEVAVVEDATVGLQQAASAPPDLILLCTELPRMNGFSVCNRLRRDPKLQSVPVIIMSSNASEETFQQHRNLPKKCANDYVHKPIAFVEFLPRIEALLDLGPANVDELSADAEALIADDEIELDEVEELEVDELVGAEKMGSSNEAAADGPPGLEHSLAEAATDDGVEEFTEDAFESLIDDGSQIDSESASSRPPTRRSSLPPAKSSLPPARLISSIPPAKPAAEALGASEGAAHRRLANVELELSSAQDRVNELELRLVKIQKADEQLHQELDEARARLESGATGIKARDVLDLREALNNKDKELLDLRDQLTRRDKELLSTKDTSLELERRAADNSEKLVELNKQQHVADRAQQAALQDRDQAAKRAEDSKRKLEKTTEDLGQTREQLQVASSERDQLKRELESVRKDATQAGGRNEQLESELLQVKNELAELSTTTGQELKLKAEALEIAEGRLLTTEQQLDQSQSQAAEGLERLDSERSTVNALADTLSNAIEKLREVSSGGAK